MNVGGVCSLPIFIECSYTPWQEVYTPRDECRRDLHPSNIHQVPLYPLSRGLFPSRRMFEGCTSFQYSWCGPISPVEGSLPLAMNIGGVYTLPIFNACSYTSYSEVHTPRDGCWRGLHPSNIHCVPLNRLSRGWNNVQWIWRGCTSFQYSLRGPIPPVQGSIPVTMHIGGVYILSIFIACPYTPCPVVDPPRDEGWRGVHPSNIHHVPLYTLSRGLYPSR